MQKLDKVAIGAAAVIILGGVVFTFLGADPGKASATKIQEYDSKIESTRGEQLSLPRETPPDVAEDIRDRFSVDPGSTLAGWNFYRRPAIYTVTVEEETTPPVLNEGVVCEVETVREQPASVFQRIRGFSGSTNGGATLTTQVVEGRVEGGEWTEFGTVSAAEGGDSFEIVVSESLEPGQSYQYRLVSTAKTLGLMFPNGEATRSVTSGASGLVPVPNDLEWECTQAQPGGLGSGGQVQPGRATITRLTWNWDKMKVDRKQHFAVEGDGKKVFDTEYVLEAVRDDTKPMTIVLDGPGRGNNLKLKLGDRAPTLDTQTWTSDDPACSGGGGDASSSTNNSASSANNSGSEPETPPPPADDDDDLFGDDD